MVGLAALVFERCDLLILSPRKPPPPAGLTTAPLYMGLWYGHGCGFVDSGGGDDEGQQNFPGGGTNDHQSTLEWTDNSAQAAEASRSLAPAKPNHIENHNQSAVSGTLLPRWRLLSITIALAAVKYAGSFQFEERLQPR
jgi:hypothetical protein